MELEGQELDITATRTISYYNPPPQSNQESSSKLPSAPIISSLADSKKIRTADGSRILSPTQTLDQHHQHHLSLQHQGEHRTLGELVPDPESAALASASNLNTLPPQSQPQPQSQPPSSTGTNSTSTVISYSECLKNHAASIGRHVLDGCGEFMPSGEEGTLEALKCAACDCHRNFHRKDAGCEQQNTANCHYKYNPTRNGSRRTTIHPAPPPPSCSAPPAHQHYKYPQGNTRGPSAGCTPPMMMAFGGSSGAPAESSSEDLNMFQSNAGVQTVWQPYFPASKKRFRTKFTQEQKDKMHEFAEKLGWRIQKKDDEEVQRFCDEVCVKRRVFKVWMHNNKQSMKKKQL